jgi:hypothetical protein
MSSWPSRFLLCHVGNIDVDHGWSFVHRYHAGNDIAAYFELRAFRRYTVLGHARPTSGGHVVSLFTSFLIFINNSAMQMIPIVTQWVDCLVIMDGGGKVKVVWMLKLHVSSGLNSPPQGDTVSATRWVITSTSCWRFLQPKWWWHIDKTLHVICALVLAIIRDSIHAYLPSNGLMRVFAVFGCSLVCRPEAFTVPFSLYCIWMNEQMNEADLWVARWNVEFVISVSPNLRFGSKLWQLNRMNRSGFARQYHQSKIERDLTICCIHRNTCDSWF